MDPLSQLQDIHLPAQIHQYPIAPGWWLLALVFIVTTIWLVRFYRRFKQQRQIRKQALTRLNQQTELSVSDATAILKWASLKSFSRELSAKLHGTEFQAFLSSTLPEQHQTRFNELTRVGFQTLYCQRQPAIDQEFNQGVKLWLEQALPPKKQILAKLAQESVQ